MSLSAVGVAAALAAAAGSGPPSVPSVPIVAPTAAPEAGNTAATQVDTTTDEGARLRVAVRIADQDWHFLIDSASTRSVIASDVAAKLNLARAGEVRVQNIGGVDKSASVIIPELGFSGIVMRNILAPALARSNLGADGLLGLDMLKGRRLTMDFRHGAQLMIEPSSKQPDTKQEPDEPGTIIVTAKLRFGQLIVTDAEIEGQSVAVIIDTGSEDSIGNAPLRKLVSGRIAHSEIKPVLLLSVTGRLLPADYTQIGRVRIGGVEVSNLPVAFAEAATFKQFGLARKPAILLGMGTLRLMEKASIDFPRHEIRFVLGAKRAL